MSAVTMSWSFTVLSPGTIPILVIVSGMLENTKSRIDDPRVGVRTNCSREKLAGMSRSLVKS